ncbi:hypothetical protein LNKW23_35820 [Paralimibaculum aggregatum]|uniref:Uncharacterized protein n=1 Tax=Paralimibaculum aggregatum TaxID=3036245 RepID=A0ABQ6LQP1_9RHOB|nr:hypothetical protein [Limibaculum sp. NKW23]GMG84367.1 hypothetical protein LNKW23_35820 [Limibaculum sp. NKW23]
MKLSDLEWNDGETGGVLNTTYSMAEARFDHRGHHFVAVEWYRRTGHPFHPYASLILITEECDQTSDAGLLRSIAFGAQGVEQDGRPRAVHSAILGRRVILIADATDRGLDLTEALDGIL